MGNKPSCFAAITACFEIPHAATFARARKAIIMFSSVPLVPLDSNEDAAWKGKPTGGKLRAPKVAKTNNSSISASKSELDELLDKWATNLRSGLRDDFYAMLQNNPPIDAWPKINPDGSRPSRSSMRNLSLGVRSAANVDIRQMLGPESGQRQQVATKAEAAQERSMRMSLNKDMAMALDNREVIREEPNAPLWVPSNGLEKEPTDELEPLVPESEAPAIVDGDLGIGSALKDYAAAQALEEMRKIAPWRTFFQELVASRMWEMGVGFLIFLNSIWIGVTVEIQCNAFPAAAPSNLQFVDAAFCALFSVELLLRFVACGGVVQFFVYANDVWWNVFDFLIVTVTAADLISSQNSDGIASNNFSGARAFRLLRFVRFFRFMRIVRVLRLFQELRTVVSSALASLKAVVWTLMLMFLMIYVVAICITQVFLESRRDVVDQDYIEIWWGSVFRSVLTLFACITSGVDWEILMNPMIADLGPLAVVSFMLYIAFCLFALLNVITGVFVEKAMVNADQVKIDFLRDRVCDAFRRFMKHDDATTITASKFDLMVQSEEMQDYFRAIDVDTSDSSIIFQILDADKSGSIDVVELITGCMRLRGPAQALHMEMLMHESRLRQEILLGSVERIARQLEKAEIAGGGGDE
eukprot:TRINITY_DN15024_c0_g2_i1.p1 TRINITY_DN15024_c0_g2~~TRINITY_DN15024_c0_g2_i1.p1  ORF type:complete len:640 (+),score=113.88 TRINITY_DN15024_c0_g2_i1:43-1962(+)